MAYIETFRTRFGKDIVAEFLPPTNTSNKVAIITTGAPGYPGGKEELMTLLAKKGYFVIVPRYRGTWESDGTFLEFSPDEDVVIIMDELPIGFRDIWSSTEYRIEEPEIYLIGGSFGGAAALLASRDERVKKVATISAVTDWREQKHTVEPLDMMSSYVPQAFGPMYRAEPSIWNKLAVGDFYNPTHEQDSIDGKKLLLIHAKDDRVVHAEPAERFANHVGAKFVLLPTGGHMGAGSAREPHIWKIIETFFTQK